MPLPSFPCKPHWELAFPEYPEVPDTVRNSPHFSFRASCEGNATQPPSHNSRGRHSVHCTAGSRGPIPFCCLCVVLPGGVLQ